MSLCLTLGIYSSHDLGILCWFAEDLSKTIIHYSEQTGSYFDTVAFFQNGGVREDKGYIAMHPILI